jgi:hypothetical protein
MADTVSLTKKLVTGCASLVLVCATSELGARAYVRHHFGRYAYDLSVQSRGSMAEDPYQVWAEPPNYTGWSLLSHFDEHGFRYPQPVSVAKPRGVRRIFILGGSMGIDGR